MPHESEAASSFQGQQHSPPLPLAVSVPSAVPLVRPRTFGWCRTTACRGDLVAVTSSSVLLHMAPWARGTSTSSDLVLFIRSLLGVNQCSDIWGVFPETTAPVGRIKRRSWLPCDSHAVMSGAYHCENQANCCVEARARRSSLPFGM